MTKTHRPPALRSHRRSPHLRRQISPKPAPIPATGSPTRCATATTPTSDVNIHEHNKAVATTVTSEFTNNRRQIDDQSHASSLKTRPASRRSLADDCGPPLDRRSPGKGVSDVPVEQRVWRPRRCSGCRVAYQDAAAIVARLERSEWASRIFNDSPDAIRVGLRVAEQKNPSRRGTVLDVRDIAINPGGPESPLRPRPNWTASGHSGSPCATCTSSMLCAIRPADWPAAAFPDTGRGAAKGWAPRFVVAECTSAQG